MVGKEGALGAGVGGNCSSGMDGSKTITRRYPGRGSVYYSVWRISILGVRLSKRKRGEKKRGGGAGGEGGCGEGGGGRGGRAW